METSANIQKPIVFREGEYSPKDIERFKRSHSVWDIRDIFEKQARELFEITHPHKRNSDTFESEQERFVEEYGKKSPGSWIYFPWSGHLIHLLDKDDFYKLRTNRNRDLITEEEQKTLEGFVPAVAGLSVGSNIAFDLAYAGIGQRAKLAEYDTLETTNLNRIRAGVFEIGDPKIQIAARKIYEINPYAEISFFQKGLEPISLHDFVSGDPKPNVIFEIIDNFEMKIRLRIKAREEGIPVISFANIGDRIVVDVERYDLDPNLDLFNGHAGSLPEEILDMKTVNEEKVNALAVRLVGVKCIPGRALHSLKKINKTLVGRPQLASTVGISGNIGAYFARRIALGNVLPSGKHLVDFDASFLPSASQEDWREGGMYA